MPFKNTAKTYLALLRLPNLFTVPLDPVVGSVCVKGRIDLEVCVIPAVSVLLMYCAGLILSDYCDREKDAEERPERPIPAGRIEPMHALYAGMALLAGGIGVGMSDGRNSGMGVTILATMVLLYAFLHSIHRLAGALLMAGCRALAVLVGAAAAGATWAAVLPASISFLYVLLLTLCADREATCQSLSIYKGISPALPLAVPIWFAFAAETALQSFTATALLSWIIIGTLFSAKACAKGKKAVPSHIGTLVRNLIIIQGAWIILYLSDPTLAAIVRVTALILFMRMTSEMLSMWYSSS